jgi:hypothetical protein
MRKALAVILSLSLFAGNALAGFPDDWGRRVAITIDKTYIDADLANWTMILTQDVLPSEMFDADGSYPALNGGGDIRISTGTDGSGRCAVDIRIFTTNDNPALGVADIAVKIPSILAASDTVFYVWWSSAGATQPAASDTYGQYNAYDSDYVAVYPLNESRNDTAPQYKNRTSASFAGTRSGTGILDTDGQIDGAQEFTGTGNGITLGNPWPGMPFTLSGLVRRRSGASSGSIFTFSRNDSNAWTFRFNLSGTGRTSIMSQDATNTPSAVSPAEAALVDDEWTHCVAIVAGTNSRSGITNAANKTTNTDTVTARTPNNATIGSLYYNGAFVSATFLEADVDEFRVSSVVRSDAWIKAEYNNLLKPTDFATAGTPETPGEPPAESTFQRRRVIIIE